MSENYISKLSKADLEGMMDKLDDYDIILTTEELIGIGHRLIEHDRGTMDKPQLEQLVSWMENGKPVSLRQIQNVFSDYATRAKEGKTTGGRRKTRSNRTKKTKATKRNRRSTK